jgi:hypothetical protein
LSRNYHPVSDGVNSSVIFSVARLHRMLRHNTMGGPCPSLSRMGQENSDNIVSGIFAGLALGTRLLPSSSHSDNVPGSFCSATTGSRLFFFRKESLTSSEKAPRRLLIAHWALLFLVALTYTLGIVVSLGMHKALVINSHSDRKIAGSDSIQDQLSCTDFWVHTWRAPQFIPWVWFTNLLSADATLVSCLFFLSPDDMIGS